MLITINYLLCDMTQIGNCVGAANHHHFIVFLFSTVFSTIYVSVMSAYAGLHIWPPLKYRSSLGHLNVLSRDLALVALKEVLLALLSSAVQLSARGLVLVYLFISSISVEIGLCVLLLQQLCYIYEGKTYLSHLSSREGDQTEEKDCQNIFRFFGCRYSILRYLPLPSLRNSRKKHKKWNFWYHFFFLFRIGYLLNPCLILNWESTAWIHTNKTRGCPKYNRGFSFSWWSWEREKGWFHCSICIGRLKGWVETTCFLVFNLFIVFCWESSIQLYNWDAFYIWISLLYYFIFKRISIWLLQVIRRIEIFWSKYISICIISLL